MDGPRSDVDEATSQRQGAEGGLAELGLPDASLLFVCIFSARFV